MKRSTQAPIFRQLKRVETAIDSNKAYKNPNRGKGLHLVMMEVNSRLNPNIELAGGLSIRIHRVHRISIRESPPTIRRPPMTPVNMNRTSGLGGADGTRRCTPVSDSNNDEERSDDLSSRNHD